MSESEFVIEKMTRCEPCRGTGWEANFIHPVLGPMLNHHKDCPVCGGLGWVTYKSLGGVAS